MILQSIYIKESAYERTIDFSDKVNLIHSKNNSCGKTTLLRFLLYALGYDIPSTKKIKFENCTVILKLECENIGNVTLERKGKYSIDYTGANEEQTFILPNEMTALHKILFNIDSPNVLNNLLGVFYVDQEKGWTLLNRGRVIGKIKFSIEDFLIGLSDKNCNNLINEKDTIEKNIKKYDHLINISDYKENIMSSRKGTSLYNSYDQELDVKENKLLLQKDELNSELKNINKTLKGNKSVSKHISDMKLLIRLPDGQTLQVTEDKIIGLNDCIDTLTTKKQMICSDISDIKDELDDIYAKKLEQDNQLTLLNEISQEDGIDIRILNIDINQKELKKKLDLLKQHKKDIQDQITKTITVDNNELNIMNNIFKDYTKELSVENYINDKINPILMKDLASLSGAILSKIIFASRLAYIRTIKNIFNCTLPIILDSPSSKEIDKENVDLMMNLLQRDFNDHQIIIASIFNYEFDKIKTIEIYTKLINTLIK